MGKWLGIMTALFLILSGCGSDKNPTRLNDFTPLTAIVITSGVDRLPAGVSTQLIATGNYSGEFRRDITSQVTWSSDQPGIADFLFPLNPGRVKGLVPNNVAITATLAGISSDSVNLPVSAAVITALSVIPLLPSLPVGLTQEFTIQGIFSDTTTYDLTFDADWSSSDATVARISTERASKRMAKALKEGTTTISAQFGALLPERTELTVTAAALKSIAISPPPSSLLSLSTQPFTAEGTYSDNTFHDITTAVTWDSSNKAVATIAIDTGTVKTLTTGTSTISATLDTVIGTSNLKVTGGNLTAIALTLHAATDNSLFKDSVSRVTARGTFSNGTSRDITGAIEAWAVVPGEIVSVSPVGENPAWVTARVVTTTPATLFATYGSVTGNSSLLVSDPMLSSLSIPEQTLRLVNGSSGRLSLTGTFSPASSQNLTSTAGWSSASPAIATVGNVGLDKGRVHAVAAGTAVITAEYDGKATTTTVTVEVGILQSLTLLPVTFPGSIIAGTEKKFMVEALYTVGTHDFTPDVSAEAIWSIDNLNVAKVSDQPAEPGLIVVVDAGSTFLTATFGGKKVSEDIVVVSQ